jgi:menaquinone-9 beta-reductase
VTITFDALIIGAGPAGATTALLLAQAGWSVAIVEKKVFPRRKVCGEFISATSLPLLQKVGLADCYLANGGPEIKRVGLYASNFTITANMPYHKDLPNKWGRAFGRDHLDTLLLNTAIAVGVKCWQPADIINLHRDQGLSHCTITSAGTLTEIKARIVVLAHGSWERTITNTQTPPHKSADLLAFKAHFNNCDLPDDLMPLIAFPGGYGGIVHTDGDKVTLSCCIRRDTLQRARKKYQLAAAEAVLQHIKNTCRGARDILQNARRDGGWLATGPIRPGIRKRYEDGVFYVGNIAGEAHPIVAEGISMAMQSAWLLAATLIEHQTEIINDKQCDNAGNRYAQSWHNHFAFRIYAAAVFAQVVMRPWLLTPLLPLFSYFPVLLKLASKLSGKIKQVVPAS